MDDHPDFKIGNKSNKCLEDVRAIIENKIDSLLEVGNSLEVSGVLIIGMPG